MAENGAARVSAPAAERQSETLSFAPAALVARELDGAAPEVGAAPMVGVDTMVARLQRKEAAPLARRDALIGIQAHYGNRYAEQVVAGLRARDEQGREEKQAGESKGAAARSAPPADSRAAGTAAAGRAGLSERASAGGRSARAPPTNPEGRPIAANSAAAAFGAPDRSAGGGPALQRAALNFVSESSDPAEREADATAKRVMRMPGPGGAEAPDPPTSPRGRRPEGEKVDRKPSGKSAVPGPVASGISDSLPSGRPLSGRVRGDMEPRFNADFSQVRVHTGEKSAQLNRSVSARAFTVGRHVFFGQNEYQPESSSGRDLIAHELTHTIQQGASPQGGAIQRSAAPDVREKSGLKVQRLGISDALDYFADKANIIPGFRMFTIIIGVNPINMSAVDRSAANILRALIEFMPGGGLITMALDNYGVFEKAGAWIEEQIASLAMTGSMFRQAIMDFLDSLSWTDIFDLGGVWQRAKRIFTEPIDRIIAFGKSVVDGIIDLIKEAILRPLAELAQGWAGFDLLCGVLGFNPITGDDVERTPELLIGGFMKMIGQEEIWANIQQSNAIDRAWAWFQGALAGILAFVASIPTMFVEALKALSINDIVELPTAVGRVIGIFTDAIGQFGAWAFQQVVSLLQIIFEVVAPGVMPYIQRAAGAFNKILEDPIGFVGNLVRAGIQGFNQFAGNFLSHLRTSLIEWLTGTLSGAGVYIPQAFSLEEIIKFVLSVLGLTWDNIREKLVRRIGEPAVVALETGFDIVVTLVREGPAAAWEKIVEAISNLREMVMEQIMTFVSERIVQAAITRLVTSLNPAGAFIQAIIAIYNTVMFFVERLRQIAQVAMAFIDSIAAIANGVIGEAANRVEQTMAGLLTLVISFLARLVGLGRVSDAVVSIIDRVRAPIDNALERIIDWIMSMARKVGGLLGIGGGEEEEEAVDPEKQAKIDAGLLALHQAEQPLLDAGEIKREEAESVAAKVKMDHPVFMSIVVVDGGRSWDYEYTASPAKKETGSKKDKNDVTVDVGETVVIIGQEAGRYKAYPVQVTSVDAGKSFTYSGPGGKGFTRLSGMTRFDKYQTIWRLVESSADLQIQVHHKIPHHGSRHWAHPLRELSEADLTGDSRNLMNLGGHAGPHSASYHADVTAMMDVAYSRLSEKTKSDANSAIGQVMAQIEVRIGNGTMQPYDDRDVWIP